jgi:hypothetical protein
MVFVGARVVNGGEIWSGYMGVCEEAEEWTAEKGAEPHAARNAAKRIKVDIRSIVSPF